MSAPGVRVRPGGGERPGGGADGIQPHGFTLRDGTVAHVDPWVAVTGAAVTPFQLCARLGDPGFCRTAGRPSSLRSRACRRRIGGEASAPVSSWCRRPSERCRSHRRYGRWTPPSGARGIRAVLGAVRSPRFFRLDRARPREPGMTQTRRPSRRWTARVWAGRRGRRCRRCCRHRGRSGVRRRRCRGVRAPGRRRAGAGGPVRGRGTRRGAR